MQKFNLNKIIIFFLILNFKINLLFTIQFFNSGKIAFKSSYNFILNSIKNEKKEIKNENIKNKNNFIKFNNFLNLNESEKIFFRNVNNKINVSLVETEYILKNNKYLIEIIKPSTLKVKRLFGLYILNKIYQNKDLLLFFKGFKDNILVPTFDLVISPGFNLIKDIAFYPWKKDDLIIATGLLSAGIISKKILIFRNKNIFFKTSITKKKSLLAFIGISNIYKEEKNIIKK